MTIGNNDTTVNAKKKINCCYRSIERISQPQSKVISEDCDNKWRLSKDCYPIVGRETKINFDSIVVNCTASSKIVYKNVHYFVQKSKVQQKLTRLKNDSSVNSSDKENVNQNAKKEKLSVIFFGTDAVSRLNFHRQLPRTLKFLKEKLKALEFYGYNKVGDNSFPNLVPIFTGMYANDLEKHKCYVQENAKVFDNCSFIWKNFSRSGYVTTLMEVSHIFNCTCSCIRNYEN